MGSVWVVDGGVGVVCVVVGVVPVWRIKGWRVMRLLVVVVAMSLVGCEGVESGARAMCISRGTGRTRAMVYTFKRSSAGSFMKGNVVEGSVGGGIWDSVSVRALGSGVRRPLRGSAAVVLASVSLRSFLRARVRFAGASTFSMVFWSRRVLRRMRLPRSLRGCSIAEVCFHYNVVYNNLHPGLLSKRVSDVNSAHVRVVVFRAEVANVVWAREKVSIGREVVRARTVDLEGISRGFSSTHAQR